MNNKTIKKNKSINDIQPGKENIAHGAGRRDTVSKYLKSY
jgi:hypothetical protein